MTLAEREYNSPLLQRNMDIIGKVVFTATHVEKQDCDGPMEYKSCYPILDLTDEQFYKEDLVEDAWEDPDKFWARYQTAESLGLESATWPGELSTYPNSGYFLVFDPKETSQKLYEEKYEAAKGALFGNGVRSITLDFAVYSKTLNYWVYVKLKFEFSIADQVIFTKSFQQFRSDIFETQGEKVFLILDILRLVFLTIISILYLVEIVQEARKDKSFTPSRVFRTVAFLFCMALFITEFVYILKQTPTLELLEKQDQLDQDLSEEDKALGNIKFIDYRTLVDNFQILYYVQAVNLILLICFLIPFFQFLTDIQSTLTVITNIGSLIVLFGCLWWAFAVMFAYVITNTWGYQLKGFRNLESAVLQMLATMVLASNEDRLNFENKETGEQVKFLFILSLTIYVLKLLIVCQVTAIIIEQYRKVMLNWDTIEAKHKHLGLTMKGVCYNWLSQSFCCKESAAEKAKKGKKRGK